MPVDPFYAPNRTPAPPRQAQPGERLFEFLRGHDRFVCELRDHGAYGVEAQFLLNGDLFTSRRFDTRAQASRCAAVEREWLEKGGA
jgi:hypothetical protein